MAINDLEKMDNYNPTNYVNNSEPDIDAEHLNKTENKLEETVEKANEIIDTLKALISTVQTNSQTTVPSSSLVYSMQQAITKNTDDIATANSNLGVQIRKISSKIFSCDTTVGTKDSVSQTYTISDLGFIKTPLWAVQASNWLNAQITNITKDSISITFYNPSERGIAGTAAWIKLIFFELK